MKIAVAVASLSCVSAIPITTATEERFVQKAHFQVNHFANGNAGLTLGMKKTSSGVTMAASAQKNVWNDVHEGSIELKDQGYHHWTSTKAGLVFKHETHSKGLECIPAAGHSKDDALALAFACSETSSNDMVRFLKGTSRQDALARSERNSWMWDNSPSADLPEFWHSSCDGHVPYCDATYGLLSPSYQNVYSTPEYTNTNFWGSHWDYPYYAVADDGYYTCTDVSSDYCSSPIRFGYTAPSAVCCDTCDCSVPCATCQPLAPPPVIASAVQPHAHGCANTRYGCCHDGLTIAIGPNIGEGCDSVPGPNYQCSRARVQSWEISEKRYCCETLDLMCDTYYNCGATDLASHLVSEHQQRWCSNNRPDPLSEAQKAPAAAVMTSGR